NELLTGTLLPRSRRWSRVATACGFCPRSQGPLFKLSLDSGFLLGQLGPGGGHYTQPIILARSPPGGLE
ncbi:hypothetical protein, partial [Nitrosococcus oceani]|uniref:hypothetical protein n=1 Tax=Nitrosococcus oceani TaxID=1229 RepID=UPI001E3BD9F8